jgi:predicted MFS family arabinose efflux permease
VTARQRDTPSLQTAGLVAGLFLLSTAAASYEIAPASVIPLVRRSLEVGPTAASWLVSVMYGISVLVSVPAGAVLDRVSVRRAVTVAGLALLVAGGWGWVAAEAGNYWSLVASRALGGVCYVVFWNAGANAVGAAVSAEYRATAVGVFTASAPVGFALGQFGSPLIAARYGWAAILPSFAALAAAGVVVFLAATRGRRLGVDADPPDRGAISDLFTNRAVWSLSTLCFLAFLLYLFLNSWLPSYLTDSLGVSLATGGLLTAVFPAMGVVSRTASGALSDRLFDRRRRPVAVLAFGATLPAVVAFVLVRRVVLVVAGLVVAGFAVQLAIGLLFSYVTEVVDPAVRTTAVAFMTSVGLTGAFLGPIAGGALVDAAGYRVAFLAAVGVALLGVVLALRAPEPGAT